MARNDDALLLFIIVGWSDVANAGCMHAFDVVSLEDTLVLMFYKNSFDGFLYNAVI